MDFKTVNTTPANTVRVKAAALLRGAHSQCTEIGLETFGRRGALLVETSQAEKLRLTKESIRSMRDQIGQAIDLLEQ